MLSTLLLTPLIPLVRLALLPSQARSLVQTVSIARASSLRLFSLGESIYVSSEKRASVINGVHPGPLIAINKVGSQQLLFERKAEGSRFRVTLSR